MAIGDVPVIGEFLGKFSIEGIWSKIVLLGWVLGGALVIALIGGIYIWKKRKQNRPTKVVKWFEEINGQQNWIEDIKVEEVSIPGNSLKVFYNAEKDLWLPRFAKATTPNVFYVTLTPNREIVNFKLGGIEKGMKEIGLSYDHTDMRWAAENIREGIKRNYKDKAVKWWQQYQNVITTAILIMCWTFSMVIIIYFLRGLATDLSGVAGSVAHFAEQCMPVGSGVEAG